ncbi:MAG: hypothetical protein RR048_01405 [Oscillospiraceae bacterium]
MRYTVFWSAFSVFCLSLCLMFASLFISAKKGTEKIMPQEAKIQNETPKTTEISEFEYILKENSGKLSVYKKNQAEPIETFNVYINTLPVYDQKELSDGIYIKNYEELLTLVEDYIS